MVSSVGTSRSILPARVTGHTLVIAIETMIIVMTMRGMRMIG